MFFDVGTDGAEVRYVRVAFIECFGCDTCCYEYPSDMDGSERGGALPTMPFKAVFISFVPQKSNIS